MAAAAGDIFIQAYFRRDLRRSQTAAKRSHKLIQYAQFMVPFSGEFCIQIEDTSEDHLNVVVVVEVGIISTVSILPPPKSINHIKSSPARPVKPKAEHSQHIKIDFPMQSMHFCNIQLH